MQPAQRPPSRTPAESFDHIRTHAPGRRAGRAGQESQARWRAPLGSQPVVVCSPDDATTDLLFDLTSFLASWCLAHSQSSLHPGLGSRASCYAVQRTVAAATQGRNDMGLLSPGHLRVAGSLPECSLVQAWMGHLQIRGRNYVCVVHTLTW